MYECNFAEICKDILKISHSVDKSTTITSYKPTVMECYCSSMELYFEKVKMSNVVDKKK